MHILLAALLVLAATLPAVAHPHVYVTARSEILHDDKGQVTGIRQAWTFDDMFSSFAIQGLDKDGDGKLTREELQPLAQTNVESLREYDYFTYVKIGGQKQLLKPPVDYWLDYENQVLTLHFTLPMNAPQAIGTRPMTIEIYDETYFVAFDMAEGPSVTLAAAPAGCALAVHRASEPAPEFAAKLKEDSFAMAQVGLGAQFANRILVNCP